MSNACRSPGGGGGRPQPGGGGYGPAQSSLAALRTPQVLEMSLMTGLLSVDSGGRGLLDLSLSTPPPRSARTSTPVLRLLVV